MHMSAIHLLLPVAMTTMLGCTLSVDRVALPLDTNVIQLGAGIQPLPIREDWTLFRVAPVWWDNDRIFLASVCGINGMKAASVNLSGLTVAESGAGLSLSLVADFSRHHTGLRVAPINIGREDGLQIGLLNISDSDSHAIQLGLLNYNGSFVLPIVNWVWASDTTP